MPKVNFNFVRNMVLKALRVSSRDKGETPAGKYDCRQPNANANSAIDTTSLTPKAGRWFALSKAAIPTAAILRRGAIPGIIGGDHSVPYGAIAAAVERHPGMGLLHIDAHADAREAYEGFRWSHASIIWNLRTRLRAMGHVVSVGLRDVGREEDRLIKIWDDLTAFSDPELQYEKAAGEPWLRIAARVVYPLPKKVWVTLDVDGLEPQYCPRTGTPVPGGLDWGELMLLLQVLQQKHEIVGFDVCEVGNDDWDANVGARLAYKLAGFALMSRG